MTIKWEYRSDVFQGDRIIFMPWLNRQGKEGWELVTCSTSNSNNLTYFHCMFKRQLIKPVRTDRANNEQLLSMLIGICNLLEAKTIDRTIDAVPNLRKWWVANRPGKKSRGKNSYELESVAENVAEKTEIMENA
jgi:hypothetical protein